MDQQEIELLINQASKGLAEHRASSPKAGTPVPATVRGAALQLLAIGMSSNQIASRIGLSRASIIKWSEPTRSRPCKIKKKPEVVVYPVKNLEVGDTLKFAVTLSLWKWLTLDIAIGNGRADQP
jgi:hypothetical protein